jgi:hypothetical protein
MTVLSFIAYLVPALLGILIVHFMWDERNGLGIFLKLCLGAGLGLGGNSLVYFLTLLFGVDHQTLLFAQGGFLVLLFAIAMYRENKSGRRAIFEPSSLSRLQFILVSAALLAVVIAGFIFINLSTARPQGARDAWSIWNRAARFIYRDPENWQATLAPELYWATHPDYPLLIPLNVAWGWETINKETNRTPMVQSALFVFGTIGLMFASVGLARSVGQASLATLVLIGTPILLDIGYAQISDIPLGFFILAASALMYLHFKYEDSNLLVLSGFSAGLAAWTKNEGMLFVITSFSALLLFASRKNTTRILARYAAGLAAPLLMILYFKFFLAPPNDIFSSAESNLLENVTALPRYGLILKYFLESLAAFPGWSLNIFIQLAIYAAIMKWDIPSWSNLGNRLVSSIIVFQLAGYCLIYLVTPHDLEWHLYFSFTRLIFHLYPAGIFLFFSVINEPEKVFQKAA